MNLAVYQGRFLALWVGEFWNSPRHGPASLMLRAPKPCRVYDRVLHLPVESISRHDGPAPLFPIQCRSAFQTTQQQNRIETARREPLLLQIRRIHCVACQVLLRVVLGDGARSSFHPLGLRFAPGDAQ